jgi:hypothetical protein
LAGGPEQHRKPSSHRLQKSPVEADEPAFITRCVWCLKTKKQIVELGQPFEEIEQETTAADQGASHI